MTSLLLGRKLAERQNEQNDLRYYREVEAAKKEYEKEMAAYKQELSKLTQEYNKEYELYFCEYLRGRTEAAGRNFLIYNFHPSNRNA